MAWFSGIKHRWNRAKVFLTGPKKWRWNNYGRVNTTHKSAGINMCSLIYTSKQQMPIKHNNEERRTVWYGRKWEIHSKLTWKSFPLLLFCSQEPRKIPLLLSLLLASHSFCFSPSSFSFFSPSLFSSLSLTWLTSMDIPLAAHPLCRCLLQPYSLFLLLSFLAFSKPLSRQISPAKMLPSSLCFFSQISSLSPFSPKPPLVFLSLKTLPSLPKQLTLSIFSFLPLPSRKSSLCQKQPPTNLLHVSLA